MVGEKPRHARDNAARVMAGKREDVGRSHSACLKQVVNEVSSKEEVMVLQYFAR
jgi:hypothetical protein